MSEELIGKYRVHPVASMFPLLEGQDYEDFRRDIETIGQLHPIIVQGDVLFDGRNRLRVCLDLGREPIITEYAGTLNPEDFISTVNLHRRHINDEMRGIITAQIHMWKIAKENDEAKLSGKSANGTAGGRGHKSAINLNTGLCSGSPKRDVRAMHTRSTVGQIAAAANISHDKAAKAIKVVRHAPELAGKVASGKMKLRDAEQEAHKRKTEKTSKSKFNLERTAAKAVATMSQWLNQCPATRREEFRSQLTKSIKLAADPFLRDLRQEIKRRRKEINTPRVKGTWNPDPISKLELARLLDWIEDELARIPG